MVRILKTILAHSVGPIVTMLIRIWERRRAKQEGRDELRSEQRESQLQDEREAREIRKDVSDSSDDDVNRWLRHPDKRD